VDAWCGYGEGGNDIHAWDDGWVLHTIKLFRHAHTSATTSIYNEYQNLTTHHPQSPYSPLPPPPPHTSPKQPLYQLLSYLTIDAEFFDPSKSTNQTEFLYVRLDNNYSTTDEVFVTLYEGIKPQVTKKNKQTNKHNPRQPRLSPSRFCRMQQFFGLLVVTITL